MKMDVIRPWIATRVTELLGFEDEEVDEKKIQIQLTGFMEKNTGKFMKELWGLLLSVQNNAETDRIAQEIQKRRDRDGREPERQRKSRFDGEADGSKFTKFSGPRDSDEQPEADREVDGRHASKQIE
ncbi:uncharacterized protein A4U43_C05F22450 [Asparagus officinalis]|uniref:PWI domain-containing protein n=1 Tax=Asparagus officinalis TaxID=4686 RepID=A0A5P1EXY2_ASPOF|nr:uncharacterized protein A4U43_C05F22450 [Asparagus officinalis]